jgi:hypothetical protein
MTRTLPDLGAIRPLRRRHAGRAAAAPRDRRAHGRGTLPGLGGRGHDATVRAACSRAPHARRDRAVEAVHPDAARQRRPAPRTRARDDQQAIFAGRPLPNSSRSRPPVTPGAATWRARGPVPTRRTGLPRLRAAGRSERALPSRRAADGADSRPASGHPSGSPCSRSTSSMRTAVRRRGGEIAGGLLRIDRSGVFRATPSS